MDNLRWILLGLGIAVIAIVYAISYHRSEKRSRLAPRLSDQLNDFDEDLIGWKKSNSSYNNKNEFDDADDLGDPSDSDEFDDIPPASAVLKPQRTVYDTDEFDDALLDLSELIREIAEDTRTETVSEVTNPIVIPAAAENIPAASSLPPIKTEPTFNQRPVAPTINPRPNPNLNTGVNASGLSAAIKSPNNPAAMNPAQVAKPAPRPEPNTEPNLSNNANVANKPTTPTSKQMPLPTIAPPVNAKTNTGKAPVTTKARNTSEVYNLIVDADLVVIHFVSRERDGMGAVSLHNAMNAAGFEYGALNIFHYRENPRMAMNAVNMFKPGYFPTADDIHFRTRGFSLALQLSRCDRPLKAFEEMLHTAKRLSDALNTRLCDAQHSSLTRQTVAYLYEEIKRYDSRRA
ncbi:MAG: hypothetical protein H0W44_04760 [Gammaproteobacteria bacterium]|nr:hypothetical protein [Gammaproteobacteria bacterium]